MCIRDSGWPFVQMETCRFSDERVAFINRSYGTTEGTQQYTEHHLSRYSKHKVVFFDLRLDKAEVFRKQFWSMTESWPFLPVSDGFAHRWHWLGLCANLLILGVVVFCVGKLIGWRNRSRGRLFSVSLGELILLVTLCAITFSAKCNK